MEKGSVQRLQSTALLHILQLYEKVRQRQRMQKLRFLLAVCEIRVAIALGTMIGLLGRHPCAKKALHQTIEESVRILERKLEEIGDERTDFSDPCKNPRGETGKQVVVTSVGASARGSTSIRLVMMMMIGPCTRIWRKLERMLEEIGDECTNFNDPRQNHRDVTGKRVVLHLGSSTSTSKRSKSIRLVMMMMLIGRCTRMMAGLIWRKLTACSARRVTSRPGASAASASTSRWCRCVNSNPCTTLDDPHTQGNCGGAAL